MCANHISNRQQHQRIRPRRIVILFVGVWIDFCIGCGGTNQTQITMPRPRLDSDGRSRRWAVVVGINNYKHLRSLDFCANDARALKDVLCSHGGYPPDQVLLLADGHPPDAATNLVTTTATAGSSNVGGNYVTRNVILAKLTWLFRHLEQDDTVLFAFAGHGMDDGSQGYLMPSDGDPNRLAETALAMSLINQWLSMPHLVSVIIIDACHSGGARGSRGDGHPRPLTNQRMLAASTKGVYGLFSCDKDQESYEDPQLRHGVFTYYLLRGLKGHADQNTDKQIDVDELHRYVTNHVPGHVKETLRLNAEQEPFRIAQGSGQAPIISEYVKTPADSKYIELYSLPGLYGKSWFEEAPWLLPSLRPELAGIRSKKRAVVSSSDDESSEVLPGWTNANVEAVYDHLKEVLNEHIATLDSGDKQDFLRMLLTWDGKTDVPEVRNSLLAGVKLFEDPHASAVLSAHLNMANEASELFMEARRWYAAQNDTNLDGLLALCFADHARFLAAQGNHLVASELYSSARRQMSDPQVAPAFQIHCLCSEADIRRKLGQWSAVIDCLRQAERIGAENFSPHHPLAAHIQERLAWQYMDQWRVAEARDCFEKAMQIWAAVESAVAEAKRFRSLTARFHNSHGLAMVERYSGQTAEAIRRYAALREDIDNYRVVARNSIEWTSLTTRLVNTTERLADCYLLDDPPAATKARQVLVEAIAETNDWNNGVLENKTKALLMCKVALAHALERDFAAAKQQLERAASLTSDGQDELFALYQQAASSLDALSAGDASSAASDLRQVLLSQTESENKEKLNRDKLDLLLLLSLRMILVEADPGKPANSDERFWSDVDLHFRLVPQQFRRTEVLPYLRRFYDRIIDACRNRELGSNAAVFVNCLAMAKTGRRIRGLESQPLVMFFFPYSHQAKTSRGFAVLHKPSGTAQLFELTMDGTSIRQAVKDHLRIPWPTELAVVRAAEAGPVRVDWEDRVWGFNNATIPFEMPANCELVEHQSAR